MFYIGSEGHLDIGYRNDHICDASDGSQCGVGCGICCGGGNGGGSVWSVLDGIL